MASVVKEVRKYYFEVLFNLARLNFRVRQGVSHAILRIKMVYVWAKHEPDFLSFQLLYCCFLRAALLL